MEINGAKGIYNPLSTLVLFLLQHHTNPPNTPASTVPIAIMPRSSSNSNIVPRANISFISPPPKAFLTKKLRHMINIGMILAVRHFNAISENMLLMFMNADSVEKLPVQFFKTQFTHIRLIPIMHTSKFILSSIILCFISSILIFTKITVNAKYPEIFDRIKSNSLFIFTYYYANFPFSRYTEYVFVFPHELQQSFYAFFGYYLSGAYERNSQWIRDYCIFAYTTHGIS